MDPLVWIKMYRNIGDLFTKTVGRIQVCWLPYTLCSHEQRHNNYKLQRQYCFGGSPLFHKITSGDLTFGNCNSVEVEQLIINRHIGIFSCWRMEGVVGEEEEEKSISSYVHGTICIRIPKSVPYRVSIINLRTRQWIIDLKRRNVRSSRTVHADAKPCTLLHVESTNR